MKTVTLQRFCRVECTEVYEVDVNEQLIKDINDRLIKNIIGDVTVPTISVDEVVGIWENDEDIFNSEKMATTYTFKPTWSEDEKHYFTQTLASYISDFLGDTVWDGWSDTYDSETIDYEDIVSYGNED